MSPQLYLLLGLIFSLYIYYTHYYNKKYDIEHFAQTECDSSSSLWKRSIQQQFGSDTTNIICLIDIDNRDCKHDKNQDIAKTKLYPLHIIRTNNHGYLGLFNDGKMYLNDDIEKENLWRGPLSNSLPKTNVHLLMMTFDRSGILMGIGSDHHIYVKTRHDLESPWNSTPVPNSDCVTYIMFDKDHRLLGLDMDGNIIKKKTEDIKSKWEKPTEENKMPLLKMYWDLNGHMLGIGSDFKLYQKELPSWEVSRWKTKSTNEQLADILYDIDGRLYGIVLDKGIDMIELRKQNQAYYTSIFYPLEDNEIQGVPMLTLGKIIQTKMGSNFETEEINKDDDNKIVDPSLEEVRQQYNINNQKKLRKLCATKKKIYNETDYYDFDLQRKIEVQDNLISKLNQELGKYTSIDKKYLKIQDKEAITDINDLVS